MRLPKTKEQFVVHFFDSNLIGKICFILGHCTESSSSTQCEAHACMQRHFSFQGRRKLISWLLSRGNETTKRKAKLRGEFKKN